MMSWLFVICSTQVRLRSFATSTTRGTFVLHLFCSWRCWRRRPSALIPCIPDTGHATDSHVVIDTAQGSKSNGIVHVILYIIVGFTTSAETHNEPTPQARWIQHAAQRATGTHEACNHRSSHCEPHRRASPARSPSSHQGKLGPGGIRAGPARRSRSPERQVRPRQAAPARLHVTPPNPPPQVRAAARRGRQRRPGARRRRC
jgi:hypothetical protein